MKLAEALQERADLNRTIQQLKERLDNNVLVQEGQQPAEQPDSGRSGFTFWQPILGMEKIQQDTSLPLQQRRDQTYGYWIASISRRTGKIEEYPYRAVTSGCPGTIL